VQTVNPSLLEKNTNSHHLSKHDARHDQGSMDVLQRARQMNMKIWALEKLQRMITTINDDDIGGQNNDAVKSKNADSTKSRGWAGLTPLDRALMQERLNGPSDRDLFSSMEMIVFKGPFLYIHDMNEKTKPVMVREYPRVTKRQDGAWPQFRSAPLGKCPFVDEPPSRKEYDRQRMRQAQKDKKASATAAQPRPKISQTALEQRPDTKADAEPNVKREEDRDSSKKAEIPSKPLLDENHERKSSESFIPPHFPRSGPFYTGREPAASGVQPSNVTSAIRSQMISSTAAAPGAKAGLSKEVHGLKRKVLERGTGSIANGSMAAPERPNGLAMHLKSQPNQTIKPAAPEARHTPEEDSNSAEGAGIKRRRADSRENEPKKPERRRDPKPGYCENCRDKFDDFEEHTLTRKHRRFAQNAANWADLDALLFEIQRPLKEEHGYDR
jgi:regulatory subunit for Cdc7p protein kinase